MPCLPGRAFPHQAVPILPFQANPCLAKPCLPGLGGNRQKVYRLL